MTELPKGAVLYGEFKENGISVETYVITHDGRSAWDIRMKFYNEERERIVPLMIEPRWGYDMDDVSMLEKETDDMLKMFSVEVADD